jgi:hypothetical protein
MFRRPTTMPPPPPISRGIFSIGACVRVDASTTSKGGVGFVSAVHPEDRKVDVKYNENAIGITNSSPFIDEGRLHAHVYAPSDDNGTRSGRHRGAAVVSGRRRGAAATAVVTPPPPPRAVVGSSKRKRNEPKNIYETLAASTSWVSSTGPHPVLNHLKEGREKDAGWMRREVKTVLELPSTPSGQLKSPERRLLSRIHTTTTTLTPSKTEGFNIASDHAYAWNKHPSTISRSDARTLAEGTLTASRKERTDAGTSIFNCQAKREQVFTRLDYYKRWIRHNNPGEPYNDSDLRAAFELLSEEEKVPYGHAAVLLQQKAANAPDDIGELLRTTNGSISWSLLSEKLRGDGVMVAHANTVRSYVMSLPQSVYQSTKILPMLTSQTKTKRFFWARGFNILWYGAKLVAATVQVVLVQSDEKWFYSLMVRQFLKCVPFFACHPVVHGVHHKNHIGKVNLLLLLLICFILFRLLTLWSVRLFYIIRSWCLL